MVKKLFRLTVGQKTLRNKPSRATCIRCAIWIASLLSLAKWLFENYYGKCIGLYSGQSYN